MAGWTLTRPGGRLSPPFSPPSGPSDATQIDTAPAVEAHPLALEQVALGGGREPVTVAAPSRGADDALPRHQVDQRAPQLPERRADGARGAWSPEQGRHLPVGHDPPAGYALDEAIDLPPEGRSLPLAHRKDGRSSSTYQSRCADHA